MNNLEIERIKKCFAVMQGVTDIEKIDYTLLVGEHIINTNHTEYDVEVDKNGKIYILNKTLLRGNADRVKVIKRKK